MLKAKLTTIKNQDYKRNLIFEDGAWFRIAHADMLVHSIQRECAFQPSAQAMMRQPVVVRLAAPTRYKKQD